MSEVVDNKENANEPKYMAKVDLSQDSYEAYLTLDIYSDNYKITRDDIINTLKEKKVIFGFDYVAIDKIVENPHDCVNVCVAKGIKHEHGLDGTVEYYIKKSDEVKPTILEDGKVDFKQMNYVHSISVGDIIGKRTLPTNGKNGTTVTGKIVKCRAGKLKNFRFGKNIKLSDDEMQLISLVDGTAQINGGKVEVVEILTIRGDVGVATGNIKFNGKVIVNGDVRTGYSIECEGDLEVNGVVESADLTVGGDLFVKVGISGKDAANVRCNGNMMCGFITEANIVVHGDIETSSIMNANVVCDGILKMTVGKGVMVGGNIQVRKEIEAKVIGSKAGVITNIRMGVDSKLMDEFNGVTQDVKDSKSNIKKLEQAMAILTKQLKANPNSAEIKELYDKTEISLNDYNKKYSYSVKRLGELNENINELMGATIKARDVYVGTKVRMGNSFYIVKNDLVHVTIQKDGGEIVVKG